MIVDHCPRRLFSHRRFFFLFCYSFFFCFSRRDERTTYLCVRKKAAPHFRFVVSLELPANSKEQTKTREEAPFPPFFFLTRSLLIFRGRLVGPTIGRLADAWPIRGQARLCLPEVRQRLHMEGEPSTTLEHRLRITTYVLLQVVRLQNEQKGHTLQAHETRALAAARLAY